MTNTAPIRPPLILIVEDDPGDFGLVRVQVGLAGFRLTGETFPQLWARTLADGLSMARSEVPDVVLLDLALPDSRGLATVRAMRAAAPDLAIIVFTGVDDQALAAEALEAGAQDYLVKGQFHHDALARAVRNAIVRMKLERKIALTEHILAAGIKAIDVAYVLFDDKDRLLFCNEKYRSLYAATADLMVPGVTFEHLIREGVRRRQFPEALGREEKWVAERVAAHRQGNNQSTQKLVDGRWLRIIEQKTTDNHIVGLRFDVTEMEQAREQAEAASAAKSMFLASMSHELRSPMNGVLGMLELVAKTDLTSDQRGYVELAQNSARNLLTLLNDILDLSKIEAGKLSLEQVPFNVRRVLSETHRALALPAREKGLDFDLQIDERIPLALLGDPARLRQIIINLLGNAIKFTAQGGIALQAVLEESRAESVTLAFSVSDTGIGIPLEKQQFIFDAFAQADDSTNRRYGGSGLGLAICSRLIRMMQGQIEVDSETGRGSTFRFVVRFNLAARDKLPPDKTYPLALVETTPDSSRPAPGPAPTGAGLNILLAEDNAINQVFAMAVLANAGHTVTLAQDGEEAVDKACAGHFDVILMDIQMPRLDGYAATRAIRTSGIKTPIVALTSHAMPGFREECLAAGMTDYLSKPIRGRELHDKLTELLAPSGSRAVTTAGPAAGEGTAPAEGESPVLNMALALDLMDGDQATLLLMLPIVLDQMAAERCEMAKAIADNDAAREKKISHRLKGSLGQSGAVQARITCALLEAAAASGDCSAFPALQQRLEAELDTLAPAIADYLEKHAAQAD